MAAPVKIVILQHPSEQKHPLATVPILKACLSHLDVHVGDRFSVDEFSHFDLARCRILFPAENATVWDIDKGSDLDACDIEAFFVLDGTWRKAKRMWFENPWLQQIPAVMLWGIIESAYRVRSSTIKGGLSTLESVVVAANYLTGSSDYNDLLKPFNAMVDMQIKKMGAETFRAHYKGQLE